MTHHRLHALALACLLAMPASAFAAGVAPPTGISAGACVEGICEYRLRNGLRVLLFPDASKPTVTVNLTYLVGSVHENYGETGMAHLLEHLLFKGTPKHADIPGELKKRGVGFNASTSLDRTNYFSSFPANDATLDYVLGLEADRMLNSFVAKKDLDSEMTVVRNELERNENPAACSTNACVQRPICGTTTATPPSARAATSNACRSNACRPSTRPGTSRTTRC